MRTRTKALAPVLATVVAAAIIATQAGAGASTAPRNIHLQEHVTNATYVPVQTLLASSSPSNQGDLVTFDDPLFPASGGSQVGDIMGTCSLVDVTAGDANDVFFCSVDLVLAGGQISSVGPFDVNGRPTEAAITGGTGNYRDAKGQIKVTALSRTANDFVVDLDR